MSVSGEKVQFDEEIYEPENIEEERLQLSKLRCEEWRKFNMGMFAPVVFHTCSRECALIEFKFFVCPHQGVCLGGGAVPCVLFNAASGRRRVQYARVACCHLRHTPVPEISAWGCQFSGRVHRCGKECGELESNREGDTVCQLTGRIVRELVFGHDKYVPPGAVYRDGRNVDDFKTEYVRLSIESQSLSEHHSFVAKGVRKKTGVVLLREMFSNCLIFVFNYLTFKINQNNGPKIKERRAATAEAMHRMARTASKSRRVAFTDLVEVAADVRSRQPVAFFVRISRQRIRSLASMLATRIVVLIGLMRLRVPGAREYMNVISLKELFISGLDICRAGISLRGTKFLSADPILMLVSSGSEDIADYWKEHVDHKNVRGSIKRCSRKLLELFQEAVTEHGIHPQQLVVDELATSIENISPDAFENWY